MIFKQTEYGCYEKNVLKAIEADLHDCPYLDLTSFSFAVITDYRNYQNWGIEGDLIIRRLPISYADVYSLCMKCSFLEKTPRNIGWIDDDKTAIF